MCEVSDGTAFGITIEDLIAFSGDGTTHWQPGDNITQVELIIITPTPTCGLGAVSILHDVHKFIWQF